MTTSPCDAAAPDRTGEYFHELLDAINDAVAVHDPITGRPLYVNEGCCRMYGGSREELLDSTIGRLSLGEPPYSDADALRLMEQARRGPVAPVEWRSRRKDGRLFWSEVNIRFARLGADERIIVTVRDISERKRAAAAAQEWERRFHLLMDQVPNMAVQEYRADGTVTYWNKASERIYGYTAEEALGRNLVDLIIPADMKPVVREAIAGMAATGVALPASELALRRKDGSLVPVYSSHVVVTVPGGQPLLFCLDIDLTDRKRSEEQRMELERQLLHAQKLESLGLLAGGIAHDFNNLLTAILGNIDLALQDSPARAPHRAYLDDAMAAVRRASDLTRQMLAYSGKGRFVVQDVNLSGMVEENAHILGTALDKNVKLRLDLDGRLPMVHADPGQLQQVVMNLLVNASEAMAGRSGHVRVATGVREYSEDELRRSRIMEKPAPGRYVHLQVVDTGCGMDEATQARMFDPFFSTKRAGRGLGLPAVLGIVRGHHGALLIDSKVGEGTSFCVLFPAAASSGDGEEPLVEETQKPRAAATGCVLVVDDEDMVRAIGQRMVERLGYRTLTAADGEEALEVFRHHADSITCILLDLTMPRLDGMGCFREIRRLRPAARVILSSGYTQDEVERRFGTAGLSGFVQKPYDLRALQAEFDRVLHGAH